MASNSLLTIAMITAESARILSNNLTLARTVNRDYDDEFAIKGAKIGQTLSVRKPARYNIRVGSVVDIQAQTETYAQLTFTNPVGVDLAFTSQELTFSLDDFSQRVLKPAVVRVANQIDHDGFGLVNQTFNYVGTPGTAITGSSTLDARTAILQSAARLYDNDAPVGSDELSFIHASAFNAVLAGTNATLFNPMKEISEIYIKGMQGDFGGFRHYLNQLTPAHTNGVYGGTPVANSVTPQTGSSIITAGWTPTTTSLNVGDVITFAGVYGVNPQTQQVYNWLQPFTITAQSVTDGSGNSTLQVSPSVVASGPFQNVSQAIPNNAAITVIGGSGVTSQQSIGFHRDAFMLATQELVVPTGGIEDGMFVKDPETDIGIRFVGQFDIRTGQHIRRLDAMYAWAVLYPQLCTRLFTT